MLQLQQLSLVVAAAAFVVLSGHCVNRVSSEQIYFGDGNEQVIGYWKMKRYDGFETLLPQVAGVAGTRSVYQECEPTGVGTASIAIWVDMSSSGASVTWQSYTDTLCTQTDGSPGSSGFHDETHWVRLIGNKSLKLTKLS
jgi:hypothetical protein